MTKPGQSEDEESWVKSLGLFTAIIADLLGCTGAGIALGYWAWKKLGAPAWTIGVTSALGLGAAFYRLYRSQAAMNGGAK